MSAIIIGGGIGGLTAAIALQRNGIEAQVFESTQALQPLGAGILIPPNAMTLFEQLGVAAKIKAQGAMIRKITLADMQGRPLTEKSAEYFDDGHYQLTIAIHRSALQDILVQVLKPRTLRMGKRCTKVDTFPDYALARFADGSQVKGDFVVGADGIQSVVRQSIFPSTTLRYCGQTCWRGLAPIALVKQYADHLVEIWGRGTRFGYVRIEPKLVYWYATQSIESGGADDPATLRSRLFSLFSNFPAPISAILAQTPTHSIIRTDIHDLRPLNSWSLGRIILIGDAAHAAAPNLGQGAAQSAEDAQALADCIKRHKTIEAAFIDFERLRVPKAKKLTDLSWRIGRMTNVRNALGCTVRNALLRQTPAWVLQRQANRMYCVRTPE